MASFFKRSINIIIFFFEKENGTEIFALFLVISQTVCFSRSSRYFSIPTKVRHYCDGKKVSLHDKKLIFSDSKRVGIRLALNMKMKFNRKLPISDEEAQMFGSWSFWMASL